VIRWPALVVAEAAPHDAYHLREPAETDAEALHVLFSAAAVTRYIPPPPASVAAWKKWMAARHLDGTLASFALVQRTTGDDTCGLVQIAPCPYEPGALMWGAVFAERTWGTGLFQAVAAAAVDIAQRQLEASALKAWIATDNGRARVAFGRLPGIALTHVEDTLCPDGRTGAFVIATIRF
jgi:RimJ/RimL family protein N-acetyltransferase